MIVAKCKINVRHIVIIYIFTICVKYYEYSVGHRVADSIMKANPEAEKKVMQIWTYD